MDDPAPAYSRDIGGAGWPRLLVVLCGLRRRGVQAGQLLPQVIDHLLSFIESLGGCKQAAARVRRYGKGRQLN